MTKMNFKLLFYFKYLIEADRLKSKINAKKSTQLNKL